MRPEYYEAIRYRRWAELEHYAKVRPEQALADTVYQLAETIGDKADRRALKKILWILNNSGFRGGDYEAEPVKAQDKPPASKHYGAAMSISDTHGYVLFLLGTKRGMDVHPIVAMTNDRWAFCEARTMESVPLVQVAANFRNVVEKSSRLAAPAPPEYVLHRIARTYRTRRHPKDGAPVPPFWKKLMEAAEPVEHPSKGISPVKMDDSTRRSFLEGNPHLQKWRLTLPVFDEIWTQIHAVRWNSERADGEKKEAIASILQSHSKRLYDEAFKDLDERLRDAAFVFASGGAPDAGRVMDVAHDFELRRERSVFAQWLLDQTVTGLSDNLEEDEFDIVAGVAW